ncbi:MAG: hypothetical protein KGK08_12335 [Acidobacteriota bacterium]|nr:hypothetical protein [Acidobacteriota bacterium]
MVAAVTCAGQAPIAWQHGRDAFALQQDGLVMRAHAEAGKPFTVAGERGVLLGEQDGTLEAWLLPIKLLSHLSIEAEVQGYSVPIDVNSMAREIEVFPDHTTITYSHIAFTVKQTMFAPDASAPGTGAVVLFSIDSVRPMDLTFRFTPEMRPMWPAHGSGTPSVEWVTRGTTGFYLLHTDDPAFVGAVTIPGAASGILAPYQERPQVHPVELKLHFDPQADHGRVFPLLMAVGRSAATASTAALERSLADLNAALPQLYTQHVAHYAALQQELTSIATPDQALNEDLRWAEISVEQLKAREEQSGQVAMVAGYYESGDSARPGFGWFFGRDSLYTLYALHSSGDFTLARQELEFLLARQRDDGKIMHEYSQTATEIAWRSMPYMYAAADATPLFLTALLDYVKASGDKAFVQQHADAVRRAWQFETTHDSDGDGVYDNAQGTGWVESWPGGMPHQEIYLALLDQQASTAMAELAGVLGDEALARQAAARSQTLSDVLEQEYFEQANNRYAFSHNPDGTRDSTVTVYPAIAWWNGGPGLKHATHSLELWASHRFATDWGVRDVAVDDPVYDPISYHQGSVWPLFTGWAALAEYRGGQPLAGYAALRANADLTGQQDLGAVTELLSGDFNVPFGRSTSHQLWSSAMVTVPLLRGLFGVDVDALHSRITVNPHLPATWDDAQVNQLHVGPARCGLQYARHSAASPAEMVVKLTCAEGAKVVLASGQPGARSSTDGTTLYLPLPAVEAAVELPHPLPGDRTHAVKVLQQAAEAQGLTLELEGPAGSTTTVSLRLNQPKLTLHATGGTLDAANTTTRTRLLRVTFPAGEGYTTQQVRVTW